MVYRNKIYVSDKTWKIIKELQEEWKLESPHQVVKKILKEYLNKEVD